MARTTTGNPAIATLKRSVFSSLAGRLKEHSGPTYPLHVGDTYLDPPIGARIEDQSIRLDPSVHRYENPRGRAGLIEAIVENWPSRHSQPAITPEHVLVTAGATGALSAIVRSLLIPGQKLLLLAPFWPLIRGMTVSHGVEVVELPFYDRVTSRGEAREQLAKAADPALAAVYINSPNNPSGIVLAPEVVEEIVAFAKRHDLWILSDEVYEFLSFGPPPTSPVDLPNGRDRTLVVCSFSKAYGMAGNRIGYLVGPASAVTRVEQMTSYLVYSVCTASQRAAEQVIRQGDQWIRKAREQYQQTGRKAAQILNVDPPGGGTFLLLDVERHLDHRGITGFLEDCLDEGLLVAPGEIFGSAYENHIRLSFTSAKPQRVLDGVELLARKLGL